MATSKKKKEKKKDFAKAKLKLGGAKQKPANATDTSFSSRTIALGQQSIARDNRGAPTTKRNLTIDDLQVQLKHYSSGTRKDALAGLRELLGVWPELAQSSVANIAPLVARMIGDDDSSVRKAVHSFLSWYLQILPPAVLEPYHSLFILFTTSAMSHIYPDIRLDAVRALNILLVAFPRSMAMPWRGQNDSANTSEDNLPRKLLECYLASLHIRSGVASGGLQTDMTPTSKALLLNSFALFVKLSTFPEQGNEDVQQESKALPDVPTWFMASAFSSARAFNTYLDQYGLQSRSSRLASQITNCSVTIASSGVLESSTTLPLSSISTTYNDANTSTGHQGAQSLPESPEQLLKVLLPIIVSAFLDSAPNAFSPNASISVTSSAEAAALDTITAVADIARDLWRAIVSHTDDEAMPIAGTDLRGGLEKLIGHMAIYFPFGTDELAKRASGQVAQLQHLNIAYCELVALVNWNTRRRTVESKICDQPRPKGQQAARAVHKHISELLSPRSNNNIIPNSVALTPHVYVQLLPIIWSLLSADNDSAASGSMLSVLVQHFRSLPATSDLKKVAFTFISRVLMLPNIRLAEKQSQVCRLLAGYKSDQEYASCVLDLPKYLWQLGTRDETVTRQAIVHLRQLVQCGDVSGDLVNKTSDYLAPYFCTMHPQKGQITGPWEKLQSQIVAVQALELAAVLLDAAPSSLPGSKLAEAVTAAVASSSTMSARWHNLSCANLA